MIKGIILRNFMSYENAYVPLRRGLNIICGPNGSGKSSILLAISLALGQSYTERSRRLSELIRWGSDEASISLILDNSVREGGRPFPEYHTDTVTVTRVLKSNASYGFLIQGKPITKALIEEKFRRAFLDPNNFLIIMHQLMISKLASISPQEKLKMLEEAVGFQSYRADVLNAQDNLEKLLTEERSILRMLESTKETYEYWRREYEKLLKKRELEKKLEDLRRELLWAKIERKRQALQRIEQRMTKRAEDVKNVEKKLELGKEVLIKREEKVRRIKSFRLKLWDALIDAVRQEAAYTAKLEFTDELKQLLLPDAGLTDSTLAALERLKVDLAEGLNKASEALADRRKRLDEAELKLEESLDRLLSTKLNVQVLDFKRRLFLRDLRGLESHHRLILDELNPLLKAAEELGPPFESPRKVADVMTEMTFVDGQLKPLAHISDEVEKVYSSYTNLYGELQRRAEEVERNRKEAMKEVERRMEKWREVLEEFLNKVNYRFNEILSKVNASGTIRLVNKTNIREAGLDIQVAFGGGKPTSLDSFSQSGGERSVTLMAFLLALQQYEKSPFRAIDEFDVHMDPMNRELVSNLIVESCKGLTDVQYVAITPGQLTVHGEDIHVIMVQKVNGASVVSELGGSR